MLFTGDLVQSGESAQFERMQAEVLDPLWRRLGELGSGGAVLLAVPGNHDLYRSQDPDSPALDVLLEKGGFERVAARFWDQPAGSYRRVVHDAFAAYGAWWEQAPHRPPGVTTGILPGDFAATLPCGDRKVGLVGLNTTFLQLAGGDYQGPQFHLLETAWPQLEAAIPAMVVGENKRLQSVCDALSRFLEFSGRWDDWLALERGAEQRAFREGDFTNAGWRAYKAGSCQSRRGQATEVLAGADRAAAHWLKAGAGARERATAIRLRGIGHELSRDYSKAVADFREAMDLLHSLSPKSIDVSLAMQSLASALRLSGQRDEAEVQYREALAIAQENGFSEGVATTIGDLGVLALDRERWSEAERLSREALKLAEEIGRKELTARSCWSLAMALSRQGRVAEALPFAERSVAIYADLRAPSLRLAEQILAECRAAV